MEEPSRELSSGPEGAFLGAILGAALGSFGGEQMGRALGGVFDK
jgi:hypothetical protein